LARWLASDGLLCVPWNNGLESGVAVFPCPSNENAGDETDHNLRRLLTDAATVRISERNSEERMRRGGETVGRRYVDHARRIAHEASNPLTVIKTYLGIIDEKVEDATSRSNSTSSATNSTGLALDPQDQRLHRYASGGPAHSGVAEILHDLRALYGEALFARRGIHFELHTSPNLPAAAIPPDALKQVLLNLFKNAAEAIPEGGKLTVSAVAGINANGSPCMEIRVVDNGPGCPRAHADPLRRGPSNSTKPGEAWACRWYATSSPLTEVPSCAAASRAPERSSRYSCRWRQGMI
jgi:signal transduction histidine kinase